MNYWIWFACIEELKNEDKHRLLQRYGTPERIFHLSKKEIVKINGIEEEVWNSINYHKDVSKINKLEANMQKYHIGQIHYGEVEYPFKLKNIYDPPISLFYLGNTSLLKKRCIGIVGARNPSPYGALMAQKISEELSENDITVISGLAKGIDGASHKGALKNKGSTIAVIGSGINVAYPKENLAVYREIAKNGLILSEYVWGSRPLSYHFPARNRIISGLSDGVIVVEATQKSGALITVDFALEQGKNVYAVPGNINSQNSVGTNMLIKEGAILYTGIQDLE